MAFSGHWISTTSQCQNTVRVWSEVDGRTEVDGLLERGLGEQARGVADTTGSRDDLSSTTVNGIGVKLVKDTSSVLDLLNAKEPTYSNIEDVEPNTTHVLLTKDTLLRRPLECSNARILDFVKILHTLGDIDEQVGTSRVGTETPDLPGIGDIPAVLISHETSTELVIVTGGNLASLNSRSELLLDGQSLDVDTVVLVLRL